MVIEKGEIVKALGDEKVICWSDLLGKLGLVEVFKKYQEENGKQYDVKYMRLGETMLDWVDSILKARIVKSKDKRVSGMREHYRISAYSMDWLACCPEKAEKDIDYLELRNL